LEAEQGHWQTNSEAEKAMDILVAVGIGAVISLLASLMLPIDKSMTAATFAVGILGALVGLSTDKWLMSSGATPFAMSEYVAMISGAVVTLFLWGVAQRLFLSNAKPVRHE